ncbi:MAG: hypothetical protein GXN97_00890 [Aquificae bacterium]|nr:hypothetical protein [Aquificota bacterium]
MWKKLLLCAGLIVSSISFAAKINISADRFISEGNKVIYIGKVVVKSPKALLTCDKLTIVFDQNRKPKEIIAEGHVIYSDGQNSATGDKAFLYPKENLVVLIGNAVAKTKDGVIKGDKLVYNLKTKEIKVEAVSQRVQSVIVITGD